MIKYNARVSRALFCSSQLSPAINRSRRTMSRSPVSKSLGKSRLRKPVTLVSP